MVGSEADDGGMSAGHVEKTNDRDYEVEERYAAQSIAVGGERVVQWDVAERCVDDIARWSRLRISCRRRPRDIWIRCEVRLCFLYAG